MVKHEFLNSSGGCKARLGIALHVPTNISMHPKANVYVIYLQGHLMSQYHVDVIYIQICGIRWK